MNARGRVENGVVVFEEGTSLPDGIKVTVVPEQPTPPLTEGGDMMSEEQQQRLITTFRRIARLPTEGSTEPFSGADHDKVLYGNP